MLAQCLFLCLALTYFTVRVGSVLLFEAALLVEGTVACASSTVQPSTVRAPRHLTPPPSDPLQGVTFAHLAADALRLHHSAYRDVAFHPDAPE